MSRTIETFSAQPVRAPRTVIEHALNAPRGEVVEVIDGKLCKTDWPTTVHTRALMNFLRWIAAPYEEDEDKEGWKFLPRPALQFSEDLLIPNIAGWREPWEPDDWDACVVFDVPDWVCEILSPSTRPLVLGPKRGIYAKNGVGHLWLVDPYSRSAEAFELRDGDFVSVGSVSEEGSLSLPPFEAVSYPLNKLWE